MRFENQTFANETITLDDNEFVDCSFQNCEFVYHGGEFNISRINFNSMQFTVGGAAARTVMLLQSLWSNQIGRRAVEGLLDPARAAASLQK